MLTQGRSRRRDHSWEFVIALGVALLVAGLLTYWLVR